MCSGPAVAGVCDHEAVTDSWGDFFVASGGAAAALTGLLFIAVSLRPAGIRHSTLLFGRARSAFYAFATVTVVALLALMGTESRLVGIAQLGAAAATLALSAPFTRTARRSGALHLGRASAYYGGLVIVGAGGLARAAGASLDTASAILATGVLVLLVIALSNSWQLVISHEEPTGSPG